MARERGKSWKFSPIIVNYRAASTHEMNFPLLRSVNWTGRGGGGGRAHYRLEFLESRPRNINRYWRVGRGLIVNVSTMIRVAKSREGLNVVEMAAADRDFRSEFRNRSFKWVLSVLDKDSLILFSRFFLFSFL